MRTTMKLITALLLSCVFAVPTFAEIAGSSHDLSDGGAGLTGQICSYCHTPHNAKEFGIDNGAGSDSYPLWSMNEIADDTGYTSYSSPTFDGDDNTAVDPLAGPSRLCMSCHDGTIAIDNAVVANSTNLMTGQRVLGTDLSNDHPVGFVYADSVTLDGEIQDVDQPLGPSGGTIGDYLYEGIMTCASCHDVHAGEVSNFLLMNNGESALCLACHIK
ncbi:MAG: hypothetical protein JXQ81_10845 [Desulfuromonadales bacterium]|nr:hypothetical protein [Desulfuromonadales bacterium]